MYWILASMGGVELLVGSSSHMAGLPCIYGYRDQSTERRCLSVQVHADEADVLGRDRRID